MVPNLDQFTLAVDQQCATLRAQQRAEKRVFTKGLTAAAEAVDLKARISSFAALVGALTEVASRLADPAAHKALEALGVKTLASAQSASSPQDVVIILRAAAPLDLATDLENRGLHREVGHSFGDEDQEAWIGKTVASDAIALVATAGGAVTIVQRPVKAKAASTTKRSTKPAAAEVAPTAEVSTSKLPPGDGRPSTATASATGKALGGDVATIVVDPVAVDRPLAPVVAYAIDDEAQAGSSQAMAIVPKTEVATMVPDIARIEPPFDRVRAAAQRARAVAASASAQTESANAAQDVTAPSAGT